MPESEQNYVNIQKSHICLRKINISVTNGMHRETIDFLAFISDKMWNKILIYGIVLIYSLSNTQSSSCSLGIKFLNVKYTHMLIAFVLTWCGSF